MATLQFTINDYVAYVFASHKKRLLVEGNDDYQLFTRLIHAVTKGESGIEIDDASCLIGFDRPVANREKVELVCDLIRGKPFSAKLTGFVDREFREFVFTPELQDNIKDHHVDGRLVWTRGHSVENYYFDFSTLQSPISALSSTRYQQLALELFERNFEWIIRMACVSSFLGMELGNFQIIRSNVSWQVFDIIEEKIVLNVGAFEKALKAKNVRSETIQQITSRYSYWEELVSRADFDIVRWACHGHIGLSFIWSTYKRFVFEVGQRRGIQRPEREVDRALEAKEEIRFITCAQNWIERALGNEGVFPYQLLQMLDIAG